MQKKKATSPFVGLLLGLTAIVMGPERLPGGSISYSTGVNSMTQSGRVPQFDPTLGTLTDVTYSGTASVGGGYIFPFSTEPPASVSYRAAVGFELIDWSPYEVGPVFLSPWSSGTIDTAGVMGFSITHDFSLSGDLGASSFFLGNGLINVQIGPFILVAAQLLYVPWATGNVTLTYTYVVPEPSSLFLAGIAVFLPLSLIVKKRFSKTRCG
jgi:hypothetical protein